jgi:hypothetical protein
MHEMVKETLLQLRKSIIAALVASTVMHKNAARNITAFYESV